MAIHDRQLARTNDHINHNRQDNRWINLREVNNTSNIKNCSLSKNSVTKINGVNLIKATNKYRAYITVNKKQIQVYLMILTKLLQHVNKQTLIMDSM